MKMIEATNLRTIDDIINQVEKIEPKRANNSWTTNWKPVVIEQKVEEVKAELGDSKEFFKIFLHLNKLMKKKRKII